MGGGIVEGAALGAAFDQLFMSVVDAVQKVARFSSELSRLKSTLSSIKLAFDDIESFNKILDQPLSETEELTLRLTQGEELIRKCCKVKKINVFKRFHYANKLSKLEGLLLKYFQIDVAALHFRETKRISVVVSDLEEKVAEITTLLNNASEIGSKSSLEINEAMVSEGGGKL